jgi:hypothetical protein
MLIVVIVAEIVLFVGGIVLGAVSGFLVSVLLKLHVEGIWKDTLLGVFGIEIVRFWPAFGNGVISLLGLNTFAKDRIDQFVLAGALVAVTLPALRHTVRFARKKHQRK